MCKFMKELKERKIAGFEELHDYSYKVRIFEPIRINSDLWLSIQASYGHYCRPEKTSDDLHEYTHWEIALFNKNDFLSVSSVMPDFQSLAEIELYFNGSVYPYIPMDLAEELFLALVNKLTENMKG
jgi:hypothetical protein